MENNYLELPEIITLNTCGGNPSTFLAEAYAIFKNDFVDRRLKCFGRRMGLKKHPINEDGKEASFFHFTHNGDVESERIPDLRRMERISWVRFLIENIDHPYLKVWKNKRGKWERILIYHEKESYLVILEDRIDFLLPWTCYMISSPNRKRKLLAEYEAYIKAKAA